MDTNRATGVAQHKIEGDVNANQALALALDLTVKKRTNWSCCHMGGVDDPLFQKDNDVVKDRRLFSCVANMVLLPTPLKAFTDTLPTA